MFSMMKEAVFLGIVAPECSGGGVAPVHSNLGRSHGLRVWYTVTLLLPHTR